MKAYNQKSSRFCCFYLLIGLVNPFSIVDSMELNSFSNVDYIFFFSLCDVLLLSTKNTIPRHWWYDFLYWMHTRSIDNFQHCVYFYLYTLRPIQVTDLIFQVYRRISWGSDFLVVFMYKSMDISSELYQSSFCTLNSTIRTAQHKSSEAR